MLSEGWYYPERNNQSVVTNSAGYSPSMLMCSALFRASNYRKYNSGGIGITGTEYNRTMAAIARYMKDLKNAPLCVVLRHFDKDASTTALLEIYSNWKGRPKLIDGGKHED